MLQKELQKEPWFDSSRFRLVSTMVFEMKLKPSHYSCHCTVLAVSKWQLLLFLTLTLLVVLEQ